MRSTFLMKSIGIVVTMATVGCAGSICPPVEVLDSHRRARFDVKVFAIAILLAASLAMAGGCSRFGTPPLYRPDESGRARFGQHAFSVLCFNTWGCRVEYANRLQMNLPDDELLPGPSAGKRLNQLVHHEQAGIANFPGSAKVVWKSKDGELHTSLIDIPKIFSGEEFIHHVPSSDIAERAFLVSPQFILVVDDRTISVSMSSIVPLKQSIDRSPYDYAGSEQVIEVFRRTY